MLYLKSKVVAMLLLCAGLCAAQEPFYAGKTPLGEARVYMQIGGRDLHLYIAKPSASFTGARPVVVTFHGGGLTAGVAQMFNPQAQYLLDRGITSVEVEYRLIDKQSSLQVEDCVKDARSAMRWIRTNHAEFGIDPDRIIGMGGSAGGYLIAADTYLSGPDDDRDDRSVSTVPNVLILYNPVLNGEPGAWLEQLAGDRYVALSPFLHISRKSPPVLILHGAEDTTVGVDDIVDFERRLKRAGVHSELLLYPGQKHGFFNYGDYILATNLAVEQFLVSLGYLPPTKAPQPNPLSPAMLPARTQ